MTTSSGHYHHFTKQIFMMIIMDRERKAAVHILQLLLKAECLAFILFHRLSRQLSLHLKPET